MAKKDLIAAALAKKMLDAIPPTDPPEDDENTQDGCWEPVMSPSQRRMYYDERRFILGYGERGSGKTMIGLHKLVRHCFMNNDALAMIVAITKSAAEGGGVWEKLTTTENFFAGPLKDTPAGILKMWEDNVEGFEFGEVYQDVAHNKLIQIKTADGGISKIMLKSMPVGSVIKDRMKGPDISFFLFEELTNTYDPDYFVKVIQQIGRRATVDPDHQQYCATCNPADEGQDHWVYKKFFIPKPGQTMEQHKEDFGTHHVKMTENDWMPGKKNFIKNVMEEAAYDPTAEDRLIHGKWVKRMMGKGLFESFFLPEIHVKPAPSLNRPTGSGLRLFPNELATWGYDPGNVNNARVLLQRSYVDERWIWRVIDEVINIDDRLTDYQLVLPVMEKMRLWNKWSGCIMPYEHISDLQALNSWNPSGSFTYREWYKISLGITKDLKDYKHLQPIVMKAPTKMPGSVEDRVKTVTNKLSTGELLVSARCEKVIDMFAQLKRAKDKQGLDEVFKPARNKHLHVFDALSYPMYYYDLLQRLSSSDSDEEEEEFEEEDTQIVATIG